MKPIRLYLLLLLFFILITGLFAQDKPEIYLRFYGSEPGVVKDVSRGSAEVFYTKNTGKSGAWTNLEKAKAILAVLLGGPTVEEQKQGIQSDIPSGTQLVSINLKDGTYYLDFSKELVKEGFGDSRVDEITDQLRVALQNINGLTGVIYTIEGKSAAYYYPDTKNKITEIENPKFTIPFSSLQPLAGGGTPTNQSKVVPKPTNGLRGKNIFIAGSHGWYYNGSSWVMQRPTLYTMSEDYSSPALVNFYMIPMLENAGAFVLWARERDTQLKTVIIDNGDGSGNPSNGTYTETGSWSNSNPQTGFANGFSTYTSGQNPFGMGSTRLATVSASESARATWTPNISQEGDYAVYVSYNRDSINHAPDAHYYVTHTGGTTQFIVNQKIDAQSWVYLGTYHFDTGLNSSKGSVALVNISTTAGKNVSADAVRFGGGWGLVTRGASTSGHFKYTECSKYYALYNGASDSTVYEVSGLTTDYDWDIATRGEFCNWYSGAPNGPNANRNDPGQGVPIDAMVSFHSDAGSYQTSVHGQLTLWYPYDQYGNTTFPDGRDRNLNFTLASTIHYQTLSDMRALYTSTWTDDGFINGNYGECRRPNVPSIIVESFSHENMNDMQYALDPQFRHDLARSAYKGIIRFLCSLDSTTAVIVPLPPKDLRVTNTGNGDLRVSWAPTTDPLESTATAVGYVIYKSTDGRGFDNGTLASTTTLTITSLQSNTIYYFKVSAYNTGGESFPTEVLAARTKVGSLPNILVVNGFERISRPEVNSDTTGFPRTDPGVWPKFNAPLIGDQTVFVPQSNGSHGVSNSSKANTQELGNTFDYVIQHGKAIANAGFWFDSASKKSIEDGYISLTTYTIVDWIAGEQHLVTPPLMQPAWTGYPDRMTNRFKTFDSNLQSKVSTFLASGKNLFISGADVSYDLDGATYATSTDRNFLNNLLKSDFVTNDATNTNQVAGTVGGIFNGLSGISFDNGTSGIYGVEQPDGILPMTGALTSMTYTGTSNIAGIQYAPGLGGRIVYLGFPFETIVSESDRNTVMQRVLNFLNTGLTVPDWKQYSNKNIH